MSRQKASFDSASDAVARDQVRLDVERQAEAKTAVRRLIDEFEMADRLRLEARRTERPTITGTYNRRPRR